MGTVTGLGTRRERRSLPILALLSGGFLLAALTLFAVELSRYSALTGVLQTDITVGGVPVGGKTLTDAVKTWETVYAQPVQLDYGDSPILLYPNQIGFVVRSDQLRGQAQSRSAGSSNFWSDFWNYLWRRPSTPVDIPLAAEYQKPRLLNFMQDVATRYEQRASGASFDLNTMTFGSGNSGRRIDIEAAIPLIDDALRRPTNRRVTLPLKVESAKNRNMATLKAAIMDYLNNAVYLGVKGMTVDGPGTIIGLVAIDLQSGAELSINPKVAFGAASTVKIPIMVSAFRQITFEPDKDLKWLMAASILCSSNSGSNYVMQGIGNGNTANDRLRDGLARVNDTMQKVGAVNTFITAPLFVADKAFQFNIASPKASGTLDRSLNTNPDVYNQTTAEDMANLLLGLYECSEYNSGLRTFQPDNYTQTECKQALELLSGNKIGRLIELGVPPGVRIAHKNGWAGESGKGAVVADAAIVYSPAGAYVLVIYVWESRVTEDGRGSLDAWRAVEGMSRVVYNYFNPEKPLLVARTPENALGAIECVMPNPNFPERVDFNNINNGRFTPSGEIVPDACINYPACIADPKFASQK